MNAAARTEATALAVIEHAIATGGSVHEAVLKAHVLFTFEAAERFRNAVANLGMSMAALQAATIDACEYLIRENVKLHAMWDATANDPDFDATAAFIIRAAFCTRLDDLYINAHLHGAPLGSQTVN